ncbi:MAG: hypothetical protein ACI32O_05290 [Enterococcus sp.]
MGKIDSYEEIVRHLTGNKQIACSIYLSIVTHQAVCLDVKGMIIHQTSQK